MLNNRKSVLIVVGLCLFLRLSFFAAFQPWQPLIESKEVLLVDALGYHQLAINLLEYKSFAYEANGKPDGLRTPLYPLFIAAIYSIFGHSPWVVMLFQIVIDATTCLILFLTISTLFNHQVAIISSVFYALDPFLIFYCSTLLSDILYIFLLVLAFYSYAAATHSSTQRKEYFFIASFGFFLGIATLVRPISVYIPFLIVIFFFVIYWKCKMKAIRLTSIYLVTFFLAISPWLFRNYVTFHRLSLSTAGQWNLLFYWAEPMEMERLNIDRPAVEKLLDAEVEREIASDGLDPKKLNPFQLADYHQRLAKRIIIENPQTFVKTYTKGLMFNFLNINTDAFTRHLHRKAAVLDKRWYGSIKEMSSDFISRKQTEEIVIGGMVIFFLAITYSLSIAGIVVTWSRAEYTVLLFLLLMSSYFVLLTGAAGVARYKLPSIPFYLCFAGIGGEYVYRRVVRSR